MKEKHAKMKQKTVFLDVVIMKALCRSDIRIFVFCFPFSISSSSPLSERLVVAFSQSVPVLFGSSPVDTAFLMRNSLFGFH